MDGGRNDELLAGARRVAADDEAGFVSLRKTYDGAREALGEKEDAQSLQEVVRVLFRRAASELWPLGQLQRSTAAAAASLATDVLQHLRARHVDHAAAALRGRGTLADAVFVSAALFSSAVGAHTLRELQSARRRRPAAAHEERGNDAERFSDVVCAAWLNDDDDDDFGDGEQLRQAARRERGEQRSALARRLAAFLRAEDGALDGGGVDAGGGDAVLAAICALDFAQLEAVLPFALRLLLPLLQHAAAHRRRAALRATSYVLRRSTDAPRSFLREHESTLSAALCVSLQFRGAAGAADALECACDARRVLYGARGRRLSAGLGDGGEYGGAQRLLLASVRCTAALSELADGDEDCRVAADKLRSVVRDGGTALVPRLGALLDTACALLERCAANARLTAAFEHSCEALRALMRVAWPRVPAHYAKLLGALALAPIAAGASPPGRSSQHLQRVVEAAVQTLVCARRCGAPGAFDAAMQAVSAELPAELGQVVDEVGRRAASDHMVARRRLRGDGAEAHSSEVPAEEPFGGFERRFFASEGDRIADPGLS